MTLNEYQADAFTTCLPTSNNFCYMMLNLVGEVGEFSSKVAKGIRKNDLRIENNDLLKTVVIGYDEYEKIEAEKYKLALMKEAGDILWQLAGLCHVMGWNLEDIARMNLEKLAARQKAGTIDGNGDGINGKERSKD